MRFYTKYTTPYLFLIVTNHEFSTTYFFLVLCFVLFFVCFFGEECLESICGKMCEVEMCHAEILRSAMYNHRIMNKSYLNKHETNFEVFFFN